ncbi:hypothetical protein DPMN_166064 [Dreissena polymorpha]|uniref:Uncharacterized protein n=1 Tax=Dreissena polymorpha TaxID=45954 RepID=A0A9D4F1W0_DREPO|nr:hypothetical protein DPMN_166064 [Dreissena polymorpha]
MLTIIAEQSTELQALFRLLPTKRIHSPEPNPDSSKKRRRHESPRLSGSSDTVSEEANDTICKDKTDREMDIRYQRNPRPSSCPCRPSYKKPEVLEIPRRSRKRVSVPLYNKILQYHLLKVTNTCLSDCCQFRCSRKWIQHGKTTIRMIFRDYY